jgi:hypothetical protein
MDYYIVLSSYGRRAMVVNTYILDNKSCNIDAINCCMILPGGES